MDILIDWSMGWMIKLMIDWLIDYIIRSQDNFEFISIYSQEITEERDDVFRFILQRDRVALHVHFQDNESVLRQVRPPLLLFITAQ